MSETTSRLLRHMDWANQRVFDAVKGLPDLALGSYIVKEEWTAGRILQHIVGGADYFVFCLTEAPMRERKLPESAPMRERKLPESMTDLNSLQEQLAEFDSKILSQSELPDEYITIKQNEGSWDALRSTILAAAICHSTEHRTQLIDALESKGFAPISLDDLDLWRFESFEREQGL